MPEGTFFYLPPGGDPVNQPFVFRWIGEQQPRLGDMASCIMIRPGSISINDVKKPIKVKPFNIQVVFSNIETPASQKEGSQK